MADEPRGNGVEHLAQGEAAGRSDAHADFFVIGGAPRRQGIERRALGVDQSGGAGVAARDNVVDEPAVVVERVEIARSTDEERILNGALQMAVGAFDGAVLMGAPAIVARQRNGVMA